MTYIELYYWAVNNGYKILDGGLGFIYFYAQVEGYLFSVCIVSDHHPLLIRWYKYDLSKALSRRAVSFSEAFENLSLESQINFIFQLDIFNEKLIK